MTSTVISVEPTTEPVTVSDLKEQLGLETTEEDLLLRRFIKTARRVLEQRSQTAFITQTHVTRLDLGFPSWFQLRTWPLQSATITYLDTNGDSQTLATSQYDVDSNRRPGRILRAYNVTWPSTRSTLDAVTVTAVVGHGLTQESVPEPIRDAISMFAGWLYCNRDGGGCIDEAISRSLMLMGDYVAIHEMEFG